MVSKPNITVKLWAQYITLDNIYNLRLINSREAKTKKKTFIIFWV